MSFKRIAVFALLAIGLLNFKANAQTQINVDVAHVLNDVTNRPVGINISYLMDGTYLSPAKSTTQALQDMGVNFLRYPGGEKADNYFWSVAPWTSSDPHFTRTGSCEWPSNDSRFAENDNATAKDVVLDFDEFMGMCQTVGGEPVIVVPYDAMYKVSDCSGTIPTREELLVHAEEWVRYANITKGYGITYWMIGNESYMSCDYNGCATATQYRDDVIEFSQRMKAVDPSIKIIANGEGDSWWSKVLPTAAAHIDYLGISNYPVWDYKGGYDYYKNNTPDFLYKVKDALGGIKNYAPVSEQTRIKVITTEFNAMDWAGTWADVNDLGHALLSFEMLGDHLEHPEVEAAIFWNTRWVNNATNPNDIYDALDQNGNLQANGRSLDIWGNHLLNEMVKISETASLRNFATYRQSTGELNIFLVNKETATQSIELVLNNYSGEATGERWEFKGTGPEDVSPSWSLKGIETTTSNGLSLDVPPVSITMLTFEPSGGPLPVKLTAFDGKVRGNEVVLEWQTASEINNDYFTVERSKDGYVFSSIGTVNGAGTVSYSANYSLTDRNPLNGMGYYRLKQTDYDGSEELSHIISVEHQGEDNELTVYPNPANDLINVVFAAGENTKATIRIISPEGKVHHHRSYSVNNGRIMIYTGNLPRGIYFMQLNLDRESYSRKIAIE